MKSKIKNNFLGKIIILLWIALLILSACGLIVEASVDTHTPTTHRPEPAQANEYFELKATTINNEKDSEGNYVGVNGKRQLIMELWGHDIIFFEGFEVRFQYDSTKLQPSIISTIDTSTTNMGVAGSDIEEYFKFESEFTENLDIIYDSGEVGNASNVIPIAISLMPPFDDTTHSDHIIDVNGAKAVSTMGGVKLGEMSFRMLTDDPFDVTGFSLVTSTYSPTTGININLDSKYHLDEQSTFKFEDATASKDADLTDLIVSSGEVNQENPDESTYKEYDLNPKFQEDKEAGTYTLTLMEYIDTINIKAEQSDEKATMKIKVPKHDSDGNLVYDSDGTTIIYEEKDLGNKVPFGVELNKLGEPDTEVTITVTAEDGQATNTYKIVIKRPYATIKGEVYLPPMSSKGIHIADIRLYKSSDVSKLFTDNSLGDWDTVQSTVDIAGDNVHDLLITLNSPNYKTNNDGTYEIYVIPGTYDLLIDKVSYLDCVYINQTVSEGDVLELGNCTLLAGDVNKNGLIDIDDYAIVGNSYKAQDGDENYCKDYDFDESLEINIDEIAYIGNNYLKVREIIK